MNPSLNIDCCEKLINREIAHAEQISGGRNSQVWMITGIDGQRYAAKRFFTNVGDPRNRFRTEYDALAFMQKNDIECIPHPLAADSEENLIVYDYIDGQRVDSGTVDKADLQTLCGFLMRLDGLKYEPDAEMLPPASEAYFTISDIIRNIRERLNRLIAAGNPSGYDIGLEPFLEQTVLPFFNHIIDCSTGWLTENNPDGHRPLPHVERTLSPSDCGFHNAVRLADRSLVFLDFEYFGWDDPAKLIIDFVLHPGMTLTNALKKIFMESMTSYFDGSGALKHRIELLYPLFGIKWSLILLNEFVPEEAARREFAGGFGKIRKESVLNEQLRKAKSMIHTIMENHDKGYLLVE